MATEMIQVINTNKTNRKPIPYSEKRDKWEIANKEVIRMKVFPCDNRPDLTCERLEIIEQLTIFGSDKSLAKKVLTMCDVPVIKQYIKKEKFLPFLHFYNQYPDITPFKYTLEYHLVIDSTSQTIETISFSETEKPYSFFTDFLTIPQK
jgi:hypothetical protein